MLLTLDFDPVVELNQGGLEVFVVMLLLQVFQRHLDLAFLFFAQVPFLLHDGDLSPVEIMHHACRFALGDATVFDPPCPPPGRLAA
jgi:hypothetical protein